MSHNANKDAHASALTAAPIQNPTKPFPAWRLPKGMINASENELEKSIESCDRWEWFGGSLVFFGVAATVAIAVYHPLYDSFLEQWGSSLADGLVAIGVAIEIKFGRVAGDRKDELTSRSNRRASEANDRAASAQRETEKLRAATSWRRLERKEHETLAIALTAGGPGASVKFCVLSNDHESLHFAQLISIPFKAAGWTVGYGFGAYESIMSGILIPETRENWLGEMKVINERVRAAFIAADIQFVNGWPLEPYMSTSDDAPLAPPISFIYVGPKPPMFARP